MGKENSIMQMVILMRENGKMIKLMERAHIYTLMVQNMLDNGKKINSMAEE